MKELLASIFHKPDPTRPAPNYSVNRQRRFFIALLILLFVIPPLGFINVLVVLEAIKNGWKDGDVALVLAPIAGTFAWWSVLTYCPAITSFLING